MDDIKSKRNKIQTSRLLHDLLSTEEKCSIISLNADCFEMIFEFLSLKDLCSIGKTCKFLRIIAGKYFRRTYPSKSIYFCRTKNGGVIEKLDGFDTVFGSYAQHLDFFNSNFEIFRYAARNGNKYLKSIQFDVKKLTSSHSKCIKSVLKNVENVTFFRCSGIDQSFNHILKCCLNLNRLTLYNWPITKYEWPKRTYQTLKTLELFGKYDVFIGNCDSLIQFLHRNQQIKKLSTSVDLPHVLKLIEIADIELDELSFVLNGIDRMTVKMLRERINEMHASGYFKQLKMFCYWGSDFVYYIDDVQRIRGLITVEIGYIDNFCCDMDRVINALGILVNLIELRFFYCTISIDQANILSQNLKKLEQLHFGCNTLDISLPFARCLPKLKTIEVGEKESHTNINIKTLNNERGNLPNAVYLTIYMPEDQFLDIKWKSKEVKFKWIQLKRANYVYPIR